MPWDDTVLDSITVPGTAGPTDVRVFVGQGDPVLDALDADAGIVFYGSGNRNSQTLVVRDSGASGVSVELVGHDRQSNNRESFWRTIFLPDNPSSALFGNDGAGTDMFVNLEGRNVAVFCGPQGDGGVVELGWVDQSKTADVELFGRSMTRGVHAGAILTANNAIPTVNVETLQMTAKDEAGNAATYRAGRVYRIVTTGGMSTSSVTAPPLMRIRKTNVAGQQFDAWRPPCPVTSTVYPIMYTSFFRVGATDVTADIVLTLTAPATSALQAAPTSPATFYIYDDGATGTASWRTNLPVLV